MSEISRTVVEYFAERLPIGDLSDEERLNYQWAGTGTLDSFAVLNVVMAFEETFGITFTNEQMMDTSFERIGGVIDAIRKQKEGSAA